MTSNTIGLVSTLLGIVGVLILAGAWVGRAEKTHEHYEERIEESAAEDERQDETLRSVNENLQALRVIIERQQAVDEYRARAGAENPRQQAVDE